jgi:hypothetical protein
MTTSADRVDKAEEWRAIARAKALGIRIDTLGGNCPIQAEGCFDSKAFYFRARHAAWQLCVGPSERPWSCHEWGIERDFGTGEDASWMPRHVAIGFICDGVEAYRSGAPNEDGE